MTVEATVLQSYSWETALFSWDSFEANLKTWATADVLAYLQNESESFVLQDAISKPQTKSVLETLTISDALRGSIVQQLYESLVFADSYIDNIAFLIRAYETIVLSDGVSGVYQQSLAEQFGITDAGRSDVAQAFFEAIGFEEGQTNTTQFILNLLESLSLIDADAKGLLASAFEQFSLSDASRSDFGQLLSEILGVTDGQAVNISQPLVESLSFAESSGRGITLPKSESFGIADVLFHEYGRLVYEAIVIAEALRHDAVTKQSEAIGFAELTNRDVTLPKSETFAVTDSIKHSYGRLVYEAVSIAEALKHSGVMKQAEAIGFVESTAKGYALSKSEAIAIADSIKKTYGRLVYETLLFAEAFGRTATFKRVYDETLSVSDALKKSSSKSVFESIAVFEAYLRKGGAVLSDMVLAQNEMTPEEFKMILENGAAVGYSLFRDFIPGDYEYRHAMFRAVLQSTTSDRAGLSGLTLIADVPDVTDRGTATIGAAQAETGIRVNFSRVFHIVPEVVIQITGGTVLAIPDVIGRDSGGFNVVLRNPTTGANVAGTFSWAAQGY